MSVEMARIADVPFVSTGTYNLASGETTFTAEDLAAAVAASKDPGIVAARVKLGHSDPRFAAAADATNDGEPALGHTENLYLSADGQTLYGDLIVPAVLAANADWAYPARSIEGFFDWESPSGRTYGFCITAVAMLGTQLPGVSTLDDLWEFLGEVGEGVAPQAPVVASAPARARPPKVEAGLDSDLIYRRLVDALDHNGGDDFTLPDGADGWSWWPRSLRFDDDGSPFYVLTDEETGRLYQLPVTISGNDVTFGDLVEVVEQYVAASGAPKSRPPVATWASRSEARASITTEDISMNEAQRRALAAAYGLADDATVEQIDAAIAESPTPPVPEPTLVVEPGLEVVPEPVVPAVPEPIAAGRTVEVSREVWEETQRQAQAGAEARAEQTRRDRDVEVEAAVRDGRITPVEAGMTRQADGTYPDGWRRDLDEAPAVTARRLASLERGRHPVGEALARTGQDGTDRDPGYAAVAASFGLSKTNQTKG